jgi:hypothetical protein
MFVNLFIFTKSFSNLMSLRVFVTLLISPSSSHTHGYQAGRREGQLPNYLRLGKHRMKGCQGKQTVSRKSSYFEESNKERMKNDLI